MKTTIKFIAAALGVGMFLLTGCHYFGAGGCGGTVRAPAQPATDAAGACQTPNPSSATTPAQLNDSPHKH